MFLTIVDVHVVQVPRIEWTGQSRKILKTKLKGVMKIDRVLDRYFHRNKFGIITGRVVAYGPYHIPNARIVFKPQGKIVAGIGRLSKSFVLIIKENKN